MNINLSAKFKSLICNFLSDFYVTSKDILEMHWIFYCRGLNLKSIKQSLPTTLEELINRLNNWMKQKTNLTLDKS